jgi:CHAT domain-containing protein/tetratricopeptide (TPR) repeat protein
MQHRSIPILALALLLPYAQQNAPDPEQLLQQADRLAWMKNWSRAEPLYAQAEGLFEARGDSRNALYAAVNKLRGELPRLPVPEVSQRLAEYLDEPIVQHDDRLRLRCLVIKGETDTDLDPAVAEQSWRAALDLATSLGESAWANRAKGELGLLAFLQGDIGESVIKLGRALQIAQSNGDVASVVRWLTLFGEGYLQLGRAEQANDYFDKALKVATNVPELQFPVMTYQGKGDALISLGRVEDAERVLNDALATAKRLGAVGYQAELTSSLGAIENSRGRPDRARALLAEAIDLSRAAGGEAIFAQIAVDLAPIQRAQNDLPGAERTLSEAADLARKMNNQILLPKLLAQLGDLNTAERDYAAAADRLDEASDLLEGLLTRASSPWVRSRVIAGMNDVFLARIRLEGAKPPDAAGMFSAVEQARGRSLLELLLSKPVADLKEPSELRVGEREISALQLKLIRAQNRAERRRLLDEIFDAEERLAPVSTELFDRSQIGPRQSVDLRAVQSVLRGDELLLEFVLAEPSSYCIAVSRTAAHVVRLPEKSAIEKRVELLLKDIRSGRQTAVDAKAVGSSLLSQLPLASTRRLIISPDGDLDGLPFELLVDHSGKRLLETHVVSYTPSGSVFAILRRRQMHGGATRMALAVSASPTNDEVVGTSGRSVPAPLGTVTRSIYDVDGGTLPPLPSANDEARSVGRILGGRGTTVLLGNAATEQAVKQQPISDYRVLHFAVHGIVSTKFPARSALVLRPAGSEDGLFQAREILNTRLTADLVTLSACDTGNGGTYGEEGVSSLVRPFLAAGAKSVVANLWSADDTFSLAIMKGFYRRLANGADAGEALRTAKVKMLREFGPQAVPKLWSGLVIYGDSTGRVIARSRTAR